MYNSKIIIYDRIYEIDLHSKPSIIISSQQNVWNPINFHSKKPIDIQSASTIYLQFLDINLILHNSIIENNILTFTHAVYTEPNGFEEKFKNIIKNRIKYVTS